jgi:Fe2+ or Zn2+ uptake regulation protein
MDRTFGDHYDKDRDEPRLTNQRDLIMEYIKRHRDFSVEEVASALSFPENSVSSQVRHLRKKQFGDLCIPIHHVGSGNFRYYLYYAHQYINGSCIHSGCKSKQDIVEAFQGKMF